MKKQIFDYHDYKAYIRELLKNNPSMGYGFRTKMATVLRCQPAFVSQVLNKDANFSLEQGEELNQWLGHTEAESEYFLLLLQYEKAGSAKLRARFLELIEGLKRKRTLLKNRLEIKDTLSLEDQAHYYSVWFHAAIHVLVSISAYQTKEKIMEFLGLPALAVGEALEFLTAKNLIKRVSGRYVPSVNRLHLSTDSPMIGKHHTNWRMRVIHALDTGAKTDLHYSTVVSLSTADVAKVRDVFLRSIDQAREIIKPSKEEELYVCALDFFNLRQRK